MQQLVLSMNSFQYPLSLDKVTTKRVAMDGLSLVELLVAMTIGLFLIGGVTTAMLNSKNQFALEQSVGVLQENARYILDEMVYDLRMAGYTGCNEKVTMSDTVNIDKWFLKPSQGIFGYNDGLAVDSFPAEFKTGGEPGVLVEEGGNKAITDMVIVNRGIPDDSIRVTANDLDVSGGRVIIDASSSFDKDAVLLISSPDCQDSIFFALSKDAEGSGSYASLNLTYNPYSPSANMVGAQFMRFNSHAYYVGKSESNNVPSLFREKLIDKNRTRTEELINGVEDMQVLYGVDIDSGDFSYQYLPADKIGGSGQPAWENVIAINLTLILRSVDIVYSSDTLVDLKHDKNRDGVVNDDDRYNDRYLRQKVSATIGLRNRDIGS